MQQFLQVKLENIIVFPVLSLLCPITQPHSRPNCHVPLRMGHVDGPTPTTMTLTGPGREDLPGTWLGALDQGQTTRWALHRVSKLYGLERVGLEDVGMHEGNASTLIQFIQELGVFLSILRFVLLNNNGTVDSRPKIFTRVQC